MNKYTVVFVWSDRNYDPPATSRKVVAALNAVEAERIAAAEIEADEEESDDEAIMSCIMVIAGEHEDIQGRTDV